MSKKMSKRDFVFYSEDDREHSAGAIFTTLYCGIDEAVSDVASIIEEGRSDRCELYAVKSGHTTEDAYLLFDSSDADEMYKEYLDAKAIKTLDDYELLWYLDYLPAWDGDLLVELYKRFPADGDMEKEEDFREEHYSDLKERIGLPSLSERIRSTAEWNLNNIY